MPQDDRLPERIPSSSLLLDVTRREFLKGATVVAAGLAAAPLAAGAGPASTLPTVPFGPHRITKMIVGSNPLYGYSHFNSILDKLMVEYFTDDRTVKFLLDCEKAGINTWQSNFRERTQRQFSRMRDAGCKVHWICLSDPEAENPKATTPEEIRAAMAAAVGRAVPNKPIGIAHHGGVTDTLFREGKIDLLKDFIDMVHDKGFMAGISTHNPAVIEAVEEKGWNNDFYMTCFYRVTRLSEEFQQEFGVIPVGETYVASDPERMCAMARQVKKPCLGFKILAAGRRCDSPEEVRKCFDFAFQHLKPTDAVIVGMFPKFSDQIAENVKSVRALAA
jgi:hypothetical protein